MLHNFSLLVLFGFVGLFIQHMIKLRQRSGERCASGARVCVCVCVELGVRAGRSMCVCVCVCVRVQPTPLTRIWHALGVFLVLSCTPLDIPSHSCHRLHHARTYTLTLAHPRSTLTLNTHTRPIPCASTLSFVATPSSSWRWWRSSSPSSRPYSRCYTCVRTKPTARYDQYTCIKQCVKVFNIDYFYFI